MPKSHSEDLRWRIVNAYKNGEGSYETLGKRFCVTKRTVQDYVHLERETGDVKPRHRPGNTVVHKLKPEHFEDMDQWLINDPFMTWVQMARKLKDDFDITINHRNVGRRMRERGWRRKKTGAAARS